MNRVSIHGECRAKLHIGPILGVRASRSCIMCTNTFRILDRKCTLSNSTFTRTDCISAEHAPFGSMSLCPRPGVFWEEFRNCAHSVAHQATFARVRRSQPLKYVIISLELSDYVGLPDNGTRPEDSWVLDRYSSDLTLYRIQQVRTKPVSRSARNANEQRYPTGCKITSY